MKTTAMILAALLGIGTVGGSGAYICHLSAQTKALEAENANLQSYITKHDMEAEADARVKSVQIFDVMRNASKLVTAEEDYSRDVTITKGTKEWWGVAERKLTFTYTGTISAGIELSAVTYTLDKDANEICITVPDAVIMPQTVDLENIRFREDNGLFSFITGDISSAEFTDKISAVMKEQESQTIAKGALLHDAREQAKEVLGGILSASGVTEYYDVTFSGDNEEEM